MEHQHGTFNDFFILLSYLIAVAASYMSLDIVDRISLTKRKRQWLLLGFGAMTMGIGMWSMHVVAMLTFTFSSPIEYNIPILILSVCIAIISSFIALYLLSRKQRANMTIVISAFVLATGITGMHYMGMSAMIIGITYSPLLMTLSILIAISASVVALWIPFRRSDRGVTISPRKKLGSGAILGVAIAGLHYVGMAASTLYPIELRAMVRYTMKSELLEQLLVVGSMATLALSFIGIYMSRLLLISESKVEEHERWYKSLYDHNHEAIITVDLNGRIINMNQTATKLTGLKFEDMKNKPIQYIVDIVAEEERARTHKLLEQSLLVNSGGSYETTIVHRDGTRYEVRVKNVPVVVDGIMLGNYILTKDITADKNNRIKTQLLAYYDELTGLPNRRMLEPIVLDHINNYEECKIPFSVMVLDIDRFKNINESLGHAIGDQFLIMVSERLKEKLEGHQASILRMGGDEFTIIIADPDIENSSREVAEHLILSLSKPYRLNRVEFYTTASIGIALFPHHGLNPEELLKNADTAMYEVKKNGKNDCKFFTADLETHILDRISLEAELRKAIEREQLSLHYQPQFNTCDYEIIGLEALLRWNHPQKGNIPPSEFIPIAEESGLICDIGEWVLKQACKQMKEWHLRYGISIPVSVNLSTMQFHDNQLAEKVRQVLEDTGLAPECLELEITESMMMDVSRSTSTLHELKSIGVKISMDDFGTGYSSLHYLKLFPIERLKIDRSFIRDLTSNEQDRAIVATIISMAKHLKMSVIAEGVETEQQLNMLMVNGCMDIQGYFFSRPLPPADIESQFLSIRRFVQ